MRDDDVSLEELTRTIELTMTFERHYAPEQLERLRQRRGEVGEERITDAQREWGELFAAFTKAMEEGVAPESEEVQALAPGLWEYMARARAALG